MGKMPITHLSNEGTKVLGLSARNPRMAILDFDAILML